MADLKICWPAAGPSDPVSPKPLLATKNPEFWLVSPLSSQESLNGGVSNGGASRSALVLPFSSFFVLLGTFPSGDSSGLFLICPFPLSRPVKSAYEEQSRKGSRHNLDLPEKKWETPRFGNPPV